MIQLLDNRLPWAVDLLELGGPILGLILLIGFVIGFLIFERAYFKTILYPGMRDEAINTWNSIHDHTSSYAQYSRNNLIFNLRSALSNRYAFITTLIKICPLLGLLGTVLGMLEVFDALAATGSNNPRSMAAGVSKATVSTLAGMVVAIIGLIITTLFERRAIAEREKVPSYFESN